MSVNILKKRYNNPMENEEEDLNPQTRAVLQVALQSAKEDLQGVSHGSFAEYLDEDEISDAFAPPEVLQYRHDSSKPNISWLKPAVVDDHFLLEKGGYLVMERVNCLLGDKPWLDTKVYRLLSDVDPNGNMRLLDCSEQHNALLNWKSAIQYGFDLRLPPPGKNPEQLLESGGKRRRKKKLVELQVKSDEEQEKEINKSFNPDQPKRKRGRPKGSKNKK